MRGREREGIKRKTKNVIRYAERGKGKGASQTSEFLEKSEVFGKQ